MKSGPFVLNVRGEFISGGIQCGNAFVLFKLSESGMYIYEMKYFFVALLFAFTSFRPSGYDVVCQRIEGNGIVHLMLTNNQLGAKYKLDHAKKDAIHAALYSGTMGCGKVNPLLSDAQATARFKKIKKSFFSRRGTWSKYTRQSPSENISSSVGQHLVVVDLPLLREDLENWLRKYVI
jgi:hypothetical protein